MDSSADVNAGQRAFWNDAPGQTWARLQDLLDIQHAEAAALLLERAALGAGEAVLDIGCGGGATTLAAADRVGPTGRVVGLDISQPILSVAAARAAGQGLDRVSFVEADAQTYSPDRPFDVAMSRFGVMFFEDRLAGFSNIHALLRPGGRICWIVWAGPDGNPLFRTCAECAAEVLGPAPPADPDAPGPMALCDVGRTTALLAAAGFADPTGEEVDGHLTLPAPAARLLVTQLGPVASRMREQGGTEEQREAIGDAVLSRFEAFLKDDTYRLPARYVVYTAIRG